MEQNNNNQENFPKNLQNPPKNSENTLQNPKKSPKASNPPRKPFKITSYTILFTVFVCIWAILVTIASQFLFAGLLVLLVGEKATQPGWTLIYYILVYTLSISLVLFVPPRLAKLYRTRNQTSKSDTKLEKDLTANSTDLGLQHLPTFIDIGLAPVAYVVYAFIASVITNFMSNFSWFDAEEAQDVGFSYFITDLDRIFAMLAIVFIAPIAEEIIMRGWLYGKIRKKWPIAPAIIIVSLIFALLHGQWNVAITVFVLSCILCGLREITGTIWSGILLHILSNGIAFYILYVAT